MKNIVGVQLKKVGKIHFFNPKNLKLNKGDKVIVDTTQGEEMGTVVTANRNIADENMLQSLRKIVRIANERDKKHYEECKKLEAEALKVCNKKIKEHKLNMNLIEVECKFDNSKMLFYFTAEERIDFRELVKELAAIYKTRIELRQIGVRDQVKRIGGNGVCGRELCCCSFLSDFETVSIKMAKEQNLSLNQYKISGNCGRLMCCLKYENDVYTEKIKRLPKVGAIVKTEEGEGEVDSVETLKEVVRVKIKEPDSDGYVYRKYNVKDIKIIKNVEKKKASQEEIENNKELEELEKLQKEDIKNKRKQE